MEYCEMKKEGKILINVPVEYAVFGTVPVVVDSIAELEQLLSDSDFIESMPLCKDAEYIDSSFQINQEQLDYEIEQYKIDLEGEL